MKLEDLRPRAVEIELNGKKYKLRPFSLATQVWIYSEFATKEEKNGLLVFSELLKEGDLFAACKITYHLMKDKEDFTSLEDFINQAGSYKHLQEIYSKLLIAFGASQPDKQEVDKDNELKKLKAAEIKK